MLSILLIIGINFVRANDERNSGGASPETILPAGSRPAPVGVESSAVLPPNASNSKDIGYRL